ncbi:hypothetical protein BD560DRAFT_320261 [Blakeslea trispora]|nr:hypothetical protein BD560DRAFT_320261 [Blakeslea trispora]
MIEFRDSIEIKIEGYVTGGRILVTPIEQRHEGKIWSQIQYTPELRSDISYRIERPDDDFTRLVLKMPQRKHNDDDCVQIHLDISLPYGARVARFITSNMDIEIDQPFRKELEAIDFQTTNGNIILNRWSGETLSAKTTNGNIKAQGSLSSGSSISLETTNGGITFFDTVRAKTTLQVSSTNGGIEALQTLEAEGSVQLKTTSGLIEVDMIEAPVVSITSSNGKVNINHARAETSFVTRTTNAPIQLTMEGVKNNHVNLKTTNAPIQLHMVKYPSTILCNTAFLNALDRQVNLKVTLPLRLHIQRK